MLAYLREKHADMRKHLINLIYHKLRHIPNSAFLQVWLQNITHVADDWSQGELYDIPLCKMVTNRSVSLWNHSWLLPKQVPSSLSRPSANMTSLNINRLVYDTIQYTKITTSV